MLLILTLLVLFYMVHWFNEQGKEVEKLREDFYKEMDAKGVDY